ncbi:phage tail tape measure protein [Xanthobacter sp. KR7-225]|uniref:phage tail tape measure protein n=1 Tax=Xanthobacter sp. KR7-225 TaxID=3156613 RepID=UPI0032B61BFE
MAGKTLDVSILVRLVDRITGPLSVLQRKFAGLAQLGQRIGILGAAVAAISFAVPLQSAAAYDQKLRDMAVTAGLFGADAQRMIRAVGRDMEQLALKTGIASSALVDARAALVAGGVNDDLVAKIMPAIARVSKAASANPLDTAATAKALVGPLAIAAKDMEVSLAKLVVAGKLGSFEFKNMAKELPALAGQMANLGVKGGEAVATLGAALQVAMQATADPTTAANNMRNFLAALNRPETIENFKNAGVDLPGVRADAIARGINPIEAVIQKLMQLTKVPQKEIEAIFNRAKGAGATDAEAAAAVKERIEQTLAGSKVGKLFGDMQALDFITAMRLFTKDYLQFKKTIEAADTSIISRDSETQLSGLDSALKELAEISEQVSRRVGDAFEPVLRFVTGALKGALEWMRAFDAEWPGVIDYVLLGVGGFLALAAALGLLAPVFAILSAGFGILSAAATALLGPVGAITLGLAALAYIIYANWGTLGPMFRRLWEGIKAVFFGFVQWVAGIFTLDSARAADGVRAIFAGLGGIGVAVWDLHKVAWTGFVAWIDGWTGGALSAALGAVRGAWQGLTDWLGAHAPSLPEIIVPDWLRGPLGAAIDGLKRAWQGLIDWLADHVPSLPEIRLPEVRLPDWAGRMLGDGAPAPAPASGGASGAWSPPDGAPAAGASGAWSPPASAATTKVGGEIIVRAEPGTQARVQSQSTDVPLVQDRGPVLARP